MEKLCMFCENFEWEKPYDSSGCPTCGTCIEGGCNCKAKHFIDELPYDGDEFRKLILQAETCPDYKPPNVELTGSAQLETLPKK